MKIPKWFGTSFLILFFIPYLAGFVPMLIEGTGMAFGVSALGQTTIDIIHTYVLYIFATEFAILLAGSVLSPIVIVVARIFED